MLKEIKKITLQTKKLKTHGLFFIPKHIETNKCCIFTHGYTGHKGSLVTWAQKMMDISIPTIIFDLPGHFLGHFNDISSFDEFKLEAPMLFNNALQLIQSESLLSERPIIGGHSLGGLLSLKASEKNTMFQNIICVGLGNPPFNKPHLFQTPFFKDTIHLRSELVSTHLHPDVVLAWIAQEKKKLSTHKKTIHLIGGKDDIIIGGEKGVKDIASSLEKNNNVTFQIVPKLAHHLPENAGIFIKQAIKNYF